MYGKEYDLQKKINAILLVHKDIYGCKYKKGAPSGAPLIKTKASIYCLMIRLVEIWVPAVILSV